MAYDLHIEREADEAPPILLEEWGIAVAATEGVRLFTGDAHSFTNPKTGEVIEIGRREGDAEVFFREDGKWHSAFRWRGDSAIFSARFEPGHPVWAAAVELASRLKAAIRGDEGEIYDLQTGKIIHR